MSVDLELATKILQYFYDVWFENPFNWIEKEPLAGELKVDENEFAKAFELLENRYLIYHDKYYLFKITSSGIQKLEESMSPSVVSKKDHQRKKILEILNETYQQDVNKDISNTDLSEKTGISNFSELSALVLDLEQRGLVKTQFSLGQHFEIKLTIDGSLSLQQHRFDDSQAMVNAYSILFKLENHLRRFIEAKLRAKYGSDWWQNGVSQAQKNRADSMHKQESNLGWKISEINNNLDYLQFSDLSKIIINQWKDIFQSIFKETSKIELKLKELEEIRNSIAHTRRLSVEAMNRLQQYSNELFNLTK